MAGLCEGGNEPPGSLKGNPERAFMLGKYVRAPRVKDARLVKFSGDFDRKREHIFGTYCDGEATMTVYAVLDLCGERLNFISRRSGSEVHSKTQKKKDLLRTSEKELMKRLVKYFVWSVALYGERTWTLRRNEEKRIEAFEMWMWRRTVRVKWTDRIRNKIVFEKQSVVEFEGESRGGTGGDQPLVSQQKHLENLVGLT
ncbi:hypothetical protein ANN_17092 [Periplaneta americana]|uniref:Uncharacterized protein n=1 Tax=Periplaneta americana TaxID=6978 RepID=A0ABQ8SRZ4_PERAM|nr:hypothetical protein ANN_17092 [Periplaneta americana]